MRFGTESGTVYEVSGVKIRRVVAGDSETMRRDGEWLNLIAPPRVEVGKPAILLLEPLGHGDATLRTTTNVTWEATP